VSVWIEPLMWGLWSSAWVSAWVAVCELAMLSVSLGVEVYEWAILLVWVSFRVEGCEWATLLVLASRWVEALAVFLVWVWG
jgi:hypothetical protein